MNEPKVIYGIPETLDGEDLGDIKTRFVERTLLGIYHMPSKTIYIRKGLSKMQERKTLLHEKIHYQLHQEGRGCDHTFEFIRRARKAGGDIQLHQIWEAFKIYLKIK